MKTQELEVQNWEPQNARTPNYGMKETQNKAAAIGNLLTGRFLVHPKVLQHWRFILFLCVLALIMTASSHTAEQKVHQISQLRSEMKELHSQFIDTRSRLMNESMESKVLSRVEDAQLNLRKSEQPPIVLKTNKGPKE